MTLRSLGLALAVTAALLAIALPTAGHAHAATPPPIPASLYPTHPHITVMTTASNQQVDCDWGFACKDGRPLMQDPRFHLSSEDALHRLSGWAQLAVITVSGKPIFFAVFVSEYSSDAPDELPWNVRAFMDFRTALMMQGYQDLDTVPRLAPRGVVANQSLQQLRSPVGDVRAMTCWTASIEAEGMVVYQHGSKQARQVATRDLTRQLRAAIHLALASPH
jgi:hypothetical protein